MPVLAACHLIYVFSVVLHCISIHVVANKVLYLSSVQGSGILGMGVDHGGNKSPFGARGH